MRVQFPFLLALCLSVLVQGDSAIALELPSSGGLFGGESSQPSDSEKAGTRDWWRKHKNKAEFIPGQGYQVEGYEGFFDSNGKPMNAAVDEITVQLIKKKEEGGLLPGLDPKAHVEGVRDALGYGPDQRNAEDYFRRGVEAFSQKQYSRAAGHFQTAADRWPNSDLAARSLFNLGESHFFRDDYEEAADAYIVLLDKHPSTPRLDDTVERLWSIAQYWEKVFFAQTSHAPFDFNLTEKSRPRFDTVGHAVRLYEVIRLNDPTGPRADDAIMATAGIHFRRENYHDADYHYSLLRREYPRSEHQFEAHVLGLQAKLRKYHGPDYDGTPLDEAKQLEERTRLTFDGRLNEEERNRLRATLAASIEARDLQMASYYTNTEHYAAARVYLNRVIQEYPDSPSAGTAKEWIAYLDGRPDAPPTNLEWFVNLFPENRKFESFNSVEEIDPDAGRTLIADGKKEAAEGGTTIR